MTRALINTAIIVTMPLWITIVAVVCLLAVKVVPADEWEDPCAY